MSPTTISHRAHHRPTPDRIPHADDRGAHDDAGNDRTPVTTVPVGEDRLSSESRLGYAGLGPIKLGMTIEDASAPARAVIENTGCGFDVRPEAGTVSRSETSEC